MQEDKEPIQRAVRLMEQLRIASAEAEEIKAVEQTAEEIEPIENTNRVPAALGDVAAAKDLSSQFDSANAEVLERFNQPPYAQLSRSSANQPYYSEFLRTIRREIIDELKVDESRKQALTPDEFEDIYREIEADMGGQQAGAVAATPPVATVCSSQEIFKSYKAYVQQILNVLKPHIAAGLREFVAKLSDQEILDTLEDPEAKLKFMLRFDAHHVSYLPALAAVYKNTLDELINSSNRTFSSSDTAVSLEFINLVIAERIEDLTHFNAVLGDKCFETNFIKEEESVLWNDLTRDIARGVSVNDFFNTNWSLWLTPKYQELYTTELNQVLVDRAFAYLDDQNQSQILSPSSPAYKQFVSEIMAVDLNGHNSTQGLPCLSDLLRCTFREENSFATNVTDSLQLDICIDFDSSEKLKNLLSSPAQRASFRGDCLLKILKSNAHIPAVKEDLVKKIHSQLMSALAASTEKSGGKDLLFKLIKFYYLQLQRSLELTNDSSYKGIIEVEMARIKELVELAVTAAFRFDQPAILEDQLLKRILPRIVHQEILHNVLDKIDNEITTVLVNYQNKLLDSITRLQEQLAKLANKKLPETQFLSRKSQGQPHVTLERITMLEHQAKFLEQKVAQLSKFASNLARPKL